MKIFSIRDSKSEGFNRPFFSAMRATAMRELSVNLKDDPTMSSYAADFSLYEIGEFDQVSGIIAATEPHHVCEVSELLQKE